ncbi:MAG TPA: MBL fold metallo-hydrolase [Spirochaetota bacterium]|nr:MBL fold metallo-hydrolase [Spirochaetota bacterium]OPZ35522.1 MAG: ribonuclease Z [Spirochaetes bacterium ADurb.BinA120]HNU93057.1 MBL fold metallo-hydrolase [Spirochaetota bacterium]HPV97072.1 MBL fold metallo-hydrolase [Spirochaetota bacterium]
MKIRFWGVRGSIPTPPADDVIREKLRRALLRASPADISSEESIDRFIDSLPYSIRGTYGGNTTCLEVRTADDDLFIIDCGTGIRHLSTELMKGEFGRGQGVASILLTHTHWDHIQGIPFFVPFFVKGNRFHIYSPFSDIKKRVEYQQVFTHFPVNLDSMLATKEFFVIEKEAPFHLNGITILNKRMRHPGGAFGYRLEEDGRSFIFTSDCEFNIDEIDQIDSYRDFFWNADVVVFDTQYTFEEAIDKIDWGHSSASIAIDIALRFNVKRLLLFHHEPTYSDEKLESVLSNARTYLGMNARGRALLDIEIAREGVVIEL